MTQNQTTINRSDFIGGSDIAAVMGMSRWQTPLGIWAEKTGKLMNKLDEEKPEYVTLGQELESFVADKFSKETGKKVRRDTRDFTHPEYPFLVAHIDRRITGSDEILECKTASAWKEKEWLGEEIPTEYILQVQWYLGITGMKKAYLAVLIGGQKFRWKVVDFDQDLFDTMVKAAVHFWREYVEKNVQPIAIANDNATLYELYPDSDVDKAITWEGDEEIEVNQLLDSRAAGIQAKKEIDVELKDIEAKIKQKLGEAEKGRTGQYTVTWKTQHRKEYVVPESSSRVLRTVSNTKGK